MPTELLTDDLWAEVRGRAVDHARLRAAISYVTAAHISFAADDVLICDASDPAIAGGLTSATVLRQFFSSDAAVFSYAGLHSKVAVIDDTAMVGSANLSENAGVNTCEAALLTDDPQVVALVLAFIESVRREAEPVDARFLQRIEAIPVSRRPQLSRRSHKKVPSGKSRVWFISTQPLSDRTVRAEESDAQKGQQEAEGRGRGKGYEIEWLRWSGNSRFRTHAKAGDRVIEAFTERRGARKYTEVYAPAPIIYRQEESKCTRLYVERPADEGYYLWRDVYADFVKLGIRKITRGTTRELTGAALGILQLLR